MDEKRANFPIGDNHPELDFRQENRKIERVSIN
jgi:hypothetical protein